VIRGDWSLHTSAVKSRIQQSNMINCRLPPGLCNQHQACIERTAWGDLSWYGKVDISDVESRDRRIRTKKSYSLNSHSLEVASTHRDSSEWLRSSRTRLKLRQRHYAKIRRMWWTSQKISRLLSMMKKNNNNNKLLDVCVYEPWIFTHCLCFYGNSRIAFEYSWC
jgi:hypothetical protein